MIISLHVYDDGDIEVTKHESKPRFSDDLLFVNDEEALKRELLNYGAEKPRIIKLFEELKTETCIRV